MTPHFTLKAQQVKHRWLSPLLLSILATVSFIATVTSIRLAAAAECQVTEDGGTIQGMMTWKSTSSSTLLRTITEERDIYGGLVPSSVLEIAPYMNSNRIVRGNTESQDILTIGACLSQDIRQRAFFNHAMINPIGKTQAKAHTQVKKFSPLPYNGKRQVRTIRTTQPEIRISARDKAPTLIGPVQEIHTSILSDARRANQTVTARLSTVEAPVLFEDQPFVAVSPFQNARQLPDTETLHMNMSSAQILHGGNCGSGCP